MKQVAKRINIDGIDIAIYEDDIGSMEKGIFPWNLVHLDKNGIPVANWREYATGILKMIHKGHLSIDRAETEEEFCKRKNYVSFG